MYMYNSVLELLPASVHTVHRRTVDVIATWKYRRVVACKKKKKERKSPSTKSTVRV